MTEDQWEMVQKTPEWEAARIAHKLAVSVRRRKIYAKLERKRAAMEARHIRESRALADHERTEEIALQDWSNDLENKGIAAVFAKYGLVEGRGA